MTAELDGRTFGCEGGGPDLGTDALGLYTAFLPSSTAQLRTLK